MSIREIDGMTLMNWTYGPIRHTSGPLRADEQLLTRTQLHERGWTPMQIHYQLGLPDEIREIAGASMELFEARRVQAAYDHSQAIQAALASIRS